MSPCHALAPRFADSLDWNVLPYDLQALMSLAADRRLHSAPGAGMHLASNMQCVLEMSHDRTRKNSCAQCAP